MAKTGAARSSRPVFDVLYVDSIHPPADIATDVAAGLFSRPRTLAPKYFYDERGSELFEKITRTKEYYPTRTEDRLLSETGVDIIRNCRPDRIIEFGSGSSRKTRRLFDACEYLQHTCSYAPFDVCEPALQQAAESLCDAYPWLEITLLIGDYHAGFKHLPDNAGARLFLFLGSTIGNFTAEQSRVFIRQIRKIMNPGDFFLIGADRVKDTEVIHAAYNDAEGITAQFNLNLLNVLNRELDADFNTDHFKHQAVYNEQLARVEMYLVSEIHQKITMRGLGETLELEPDERILSELSYKYRPQDLQDLLAAAGLDVIRHFEPPDGWFSLMLSQLR